MNLKKMSLGNEHKFTFFKWIPRGQMNLTFSNYFKHVNSFSYLIFIIKLTRIYVLYKIEIKLFINKNYCVKGES